MENFNVLLFIFQSVIVFVVVGIIFYFVIAYRSYKLEKRFNKFSLNYEDEELTFFDKIINIFSTLVNKLSNVLNRFNTIYRYSGKYDKYISFEERVAKDGTDFVAIKLILGLVFLILSIGINLNVIVQLIYFIVGFYLIDLPLFLIYKSKEKRIENELLNAIIVMNNSFKAGASIIQAIDIVKNDLDGPISDEFKKIANDLKFGLSIEDAFDRFYKRINLDEVKYISSSLSLLKQTGGNIVKVFSSIEKSFNIRKKLKEEYESMIAASKFIHKLLLILPVIIIIVIYLLNNNYFNILIESPLGVFIIFIIIIIYSSYLALANKILKVQI